MDEDTEKLLMQYILQRCENEQNQTRLGFFLKKKKCLNTIIGYIIDH